METSIQGMQDRTNVHIDEHWCAEHEEATDDTVENLCVGFDCVDDEVHLMLRFVGSEFRILLD
jgi:hypothetical protein